MCFVGEVDRQKCVQPYFMSGPLAEVLTIANVRQATEAVDWWCSLKWVFLKVSQISKENTRWSLFLIKLINFLINFIKKRLQHRCFHVKVFKNTFLIRTPPVAASHPASRIWTPSKVGRRFEVAQKLSFDCLHEAAQQWWPLQHRVLTTLSNLSNNNAHHWIFFLKIAPLPVHS